MARKLPEFTVRFVNRLIDKLELLDIPNNLNYINPKYNSQPYSQHRYYSKKYVLALREKARLELKRNVANFQLATTLKG